MPRSPATPARARHGCAHACEAMRLTCRRTQAAPDRDVPHEHDLVEARIGLLHARLDLLYCLAVALARLVARTLGQLPGLILLALALGHRPAGVGGVGGEVNDDAGHADHAERDVGGDETVFDGGVG